MSSATGTTSRKRLIFYFQVHQPRRLRTLRFFDIGANKNYFDDELNKNIIQRIARNCYLPANDLLLKLIRKNPDMRVAFSISGIAIDQLEQYAPETLHSFRELADTGCVDFLTETHYHSLACLIPGNEFELQADKHQKKILSHFGVRSRVFRNTELIYSDQTGKRIHELGYKGVIIDGVDHLFRHRSPHHVFESYHAPGLKVLARNYRLSDDISFRFSQSTVKLSVDKYMSWLNEIPAHENVVTLAMDYETFGEHQKKDTGIFTFMKKLFGDLGRSRNFAFMTPSEAVERMSAAEALEVPGFISWADQERDLSAWLGNEMQRDAFDSLLKLERDVKDLLDKDLLNQWRSLQTSDHFYYMSTKKGSDGEVHNYFSPYPSPYEAFINYMNVITDLSLRLKVCKSGAVPGSTANEDHASAEALTVTA